MALVASGIAPPAAPAPTVNAQLVPPIQQKPQINSLPLTTQSLNLLGAGQPYPGGSYNG